jgi:hypothetical protein
MRSPHYVERHGRIEECFKEMGIEIPNKAGALGPVHRMIEELCPDDQKVVQSERAYSTEKKRRERVEKRLDKTREGILTLIGMLEAKVKRSKVLKKLYRIYNIQVHNDNLED